MGELLMSNSHNPLIADLSTVSKNLRNDYGIKWTKYDPDVIPMWVADMDYGIAPEIVHRLHRVIDGYGVGYARQELADAVLFSLVERYRILFATHLEASLMLLATDVVQAIYFAISTFSSPGDSVVVQSPIYPPFMTAINDLNRELSYNPLVETEDGYQLDLENLEALCSEPDTRILLLCNPHNPSGRVFGLHELTVIAEIAAKHRVLVISDEIHGEITFDSHTHIPFPLVAKEIGTSYILLTSASKAFNLAGLRCAVATFSDSNLRSEFEKTPFHLRGAVSNLGMAGTVAAWTCADAWQREVMEQLAENRSFITSYLAEQNTDIVYRKPEGTYLAWLDFTRLEGWEDPADILEKRARIALSPGDSFGPGGSGHARLNFATTPAVLRDALSRIVGSL